MRNRVAPTVLPTLALTAIETRLLDRLIPDRMDEQRTNKQSQQGSLSSHLTKIDRQGGYFARAKDPPRGNRVASFPDFAKFCED